MVNQPAPGAQRQVEHHRRQQIHDQGVVVSWQKRHLHAVAVPAGRELAPTLPAVGTPALTAPADGAERPQFSDCRRAELLPGQSAPRARMGGAGWILKAGSLS